MTMFKASQALVDVLLKSGFSDRTEKLYPEHFKRMKTKGYDPYSMKRIFCLDNHEDYIIFRFVYITLHHRGKFNFKIERRLLNVDEVKSLICFYKLPVEAAKEWVEAYSNALGLYKYYRNICALPEVYNSDLDKCIKYTFESIAIKE